MTTSPKKRYRFYYQGKPVRELKWHPATGVHRILAGPGDRIVVMRGGRALDFILAHMLERGEDFVAEPMG